MIQTTCTTTYLYLVYCDGNISCDCGDVEQRLRKHGLSENSARCYLSALGLGDLLKYIDSIEAIKHGNPQVSDAGGNRFMSSSWVSIKNGSLYLLNISRDVYFPFYLPLYRGGKGGLNGPKVWKSVEEIGCLEFIFLFFMK